MSLNWSLQNVKTRREVAGELVADCDDASHNDPCDVCPKVPRVAVHTVSGEPIPWAVTNGLIWATMAVQMHGIASEKEAQEFAVRLAVYQKMFGPWLMHHAKGRRPTPRAITPAEVFAHIGLGTNVSTRSRGQFLKAMSEQLARELEKDEVAPVIEHQKEVARKRAAGEPV